MVWIKLISLATCLIFKQITIEESICLTRHHEKAFNFLKPILNNL